jgi:hypothetical protein
VKQFFAVFRGRGLQALATATILVVFYDLYVALDQLEQGSPWLGALWIFLAAVTTWSSYNLLRLDRQQRLHRQVIRLTEQLLPPDAAEPLMLEHGPDRLVLTPVDPIENAAGRIGGTIFISRGTVDELELLRHDRDEEHWDVPADLFVLVRGLRYICFSPTTLHAFRVPTLNGADGLAEMLGGNSNLRMATAAELKQLLEQLQDGTRPPTDWALLNSNLWARRKLATTIS